MRFMLTLCRASGSSKLNNAPGRLSEATNSAVLSSPDGWIGWTIKNRVVLLGSSSMLRTKVGN